MQMAVFDKALNQSVNFIYNCTISINEIRTSKSRREYDLNIKNDYIIEKEWSRPGDVIKKYFLKWILFPEPLRYIKWLRDKYNNDVFVKYRWMSTLE